MAERAQGTGRGGEGVNYGNRIYRRINGRRSIYTPRIWEFDYSQFDRNEDSTYTIQHMPRYESFM